MTGLTPTIDPASSFSDAPPKKARYTPASLTVSPVGTSVQSFTPGQVAYTGGITGASMTSSLNVGAPLPSAPLQSSMPGSTLAPPGSARANSNSLSVPSTPMMGMMNGGMPYPLSPFGFNMNMVGDPGFER
jgi:hypothetical protein